jgi:chloramphenicol-sensitive protein RarD
LITYFGAGAILAVNWGTFIYAVQFRAYGWIKSWLFYYPMVSVLLGVVFLKERLRLWHVGFRLVWQPFWVFLITVVYGSIPLLGIWYGNSHLVYMVWLKKITPLDSHTRGWTLKQVWSFSGTGISDHPGFIGVGFIGHTGWSTAILWLSAVLLQPFHCALRQRCPAYNLSTIGFCNMLVRPFNFSWERL